MKNLLSKNEFRFITDSYFSMYVKLGMNKHEKTKADHFLSKSLVGRVLSMIVGKNLLSKNEFRFITD